MGIVVNISHGARLDVKSASMIGNTRVLKAARILLGWSQTYLAERAGISASALSRLETGADIRKSTALAVESALERSGGIKFLHATDTEGEGVRLTDPKSYGKPESAGPHGVDRL
jgi:transcriptional regulator with XRE-family HTH domain